jgi:micrococcal nuclease
LGLAWHYKQYNKDEELAKLEQQAQQNKIGLWSQSNPVAPWDFRRK